MAYGTTNVDNIQSSAVGTPVVFKDGGGTQIGTLCRAWVNFNGTGTVAIRGSFNVSSITDNGTGLYTVNLTNALTDANYSAVASGDVSSGVPQMRVTNSSASAIGIITWNNSTLTDASSVSVSVFR